jgi:prepilin-type N-terminal cleavage/methylation domain-containing protein
MRRPRRCHGSGFTIELITTFRRGDRGFSLIEVLVATLVFGLMTVGIIPLLLSSLKGSTLARMQTVGKNLAQESMERVRGLPLFDTAAGRDVLDLYFPNLSTGYDAATQTFTTTCTRTSSLPAPSAARGCPKLPSGTSKIPTGYTLTFRATFVSPTPASNPETFTDVAPAATYSSAAAGTATPPTKLVRFVIRASWLFQARPQAFELTSLIGDRRLSPDRVRGNATVDFVAQALTSFQVGTSISGLTATMGTSDSTVEIRNFAAAIGDVNAGELVLARDQSAVTPGAVIDSAAGAVSSLRAPPDTSPAAAVTAGADTIVHDDLLPPGTQVAAIGATSVNQGSPLAEVKVPNGIPRASNHLDYGGVGELLWVNNQADTTDNALLKLDPTRHVFSVHRPVGDAKTSAFTSAEATALTPAGSRKVESIAHAESGKMVLLPATYTLLGSDRGVIVISDFMADVTCKSTGPISAPTVTGSWSATFQYWRDSNPTNDLAVGGYATVQTAGGPAGKISGNVTSTAVDPLAAIKTENPLVYDGTGTPTDPDVYLFNDTTAEPDKLGYLDHWSSSPVMTSTAANQIARVGMPSALQIVTAKTDPTNEESKLAISIGKISCEAVDLR